MAVQADYDRLLDTFEAERRRPSECVRYLMNHGFSHGQANSAVYVYRMKRGLLEREAEMENDQVKHDDEPELKVRAATASGTTASDRGPEYDIEVTADGTE
jgi:hypothetical protein